MKLNGKKIKEFRQSKGLSVFNLATELEISKSTIENIEDGRRDGKKDGVSLETAMKLAGFFGVKVEELI